MSKIINNYNVIDLFAGCGGFSVGFMQEGFDVVLANDIDEQASLTYKHNHPNTSFILGDIAQLNSEDLIKTLNGKEVDVLVGGIPCQSFSMAGNRTRDKVANLNDSRHYLFKQFIRIAGILKPKFIVIENVKSLLSFQNGKIKNDIISGLNKEGYKVDVDVLNALHYGVAQSRERAIFIGNRIGVVNRFPEKLYDDKNYITIKDAFKNIPNDNHEPRPLSGKVLQRVKLIKPGENWRVLPKHLQTGSRHSGSYGRLKLNGYSRTLTTRFDTPPGGYVTHPIEHRTITVREGARIQGFPDDFIFFGNKISQYKQVGNAVAVGVSRAIAKSIKNILDGVS